MVAIDLLTGESRGVFVPEGGTAALSYSQKIDQWQKDIDNDLDGLKELQVVGVSR